MENQSKNVLTEEKKNEIYKYHKNLIKNGGGYGGSITKRVRERFGISGDEVSDIYMECKAKEQQCNEVKSKWIFLKERKRVEGRGFFIKNIIGDIIASANEIKDAELICIAVNNHQQLFDALADILSDPTTSNTMRNRYQALLNLKNF